MEARKKVEADPLKRSCLYNSKVWHKMGADEYEYAMVATLQHLQAKNDSSIYQLNIFRFNYSHSQVKLK